MINSVFGKSGLRSIVAITTVLVAGAVNGATYSAPSWVATSWGSPAPSYSWQNNDSACTQNGISGGSFQRTSAGNDGAAELNLPVLQPRQAYRAAIWLKAKSANVTLDLFYRRDGAPYETTSIRVIRADNAWKQYEIRGVYAASAAGSIRIGLRTQGQQVCVGPITVDAIDPSLVGASASAAVIAPSFFGIHVNKLGVHNQWPSFNPGLMRLWDTGTTWAIIQPTSGNIDFARNAGTTRIDQYLAYQKKNYPTGFPLMTLAMSPSWAAPADSDSCQNLGYGPSACSKPASLDSWRSFVRQMAQHYNGQIKYWELWNEADQAIFWHDSPANMVAMAQVAYQELKAANPGNVLIGPNVTSMGLGFLNDFIMAGGAAYIDGVSVHLYYGRQPGAAEQVARNVRELIYSHGLTLPIWNTETGVNCMFTVESCSAVVGQGSSILKPEISLAQGLLGQAALNVVTNAYYYYEGAVLDEGGRALVGSDFATPTAEGKAMARVRNWILNATLVETPSSTPRVRIVKVNRGAGQAYVAWSDAGSVSVPRSLFGNPTQSQKLTATGVVAQTGDSVTVDAEPVLLFTSDFVPTVSN